MSPLDAPSRPTDREPTPTPVAPPADPTTRPVAVLPVADPSSEPGGVLPVADPSSEPGGVLATDRAGVARPVRRGWRMAPADAVGARRAENRGRLWIALSWLLCPCHLPVSMAVIATLAGGSAVGAALTASAWRLGAIMGVLYALALWRGFRHLRRARAELAAAGIDCRDGACRVPPSA